MQEIQGRSLAKIFNSTRSGIVEPGRDHVLIGKERHDVGRPHDWGYPIRGIVKGKLLYVRNFQTDRWPAGNPETGYLNCDGSPTKTECLQARKNPETKKYWQMAFGKRPTEELYDLAEDPDELVNLAAHGDAERLLAPWRERMIAEARRYRDDKLLDGDGQATAPLDRSKFRELPVGGIGWRWF